MGVYENIRESREGLITRFAATHEPPQPKKLLALRAAKRDLATAEHHLKTMSGIDAETGMAVGAASYPTPWSTLPARAEVEGRASMARDYVSLRQSGMTTSPAKKRSGWTGSVSAALAAIKAAEQQEWRENIPAVIASHRAAVEAEVLSLRQRLEAAEAIAEDDAETLAAWLEWEGDVSYDLDHAMDDFDAEG